MGMTNSSAMFYGNIKDTLTISKKKDNSIFVSDEYLDLLHNINNCFSYLNLIHLQLFVKRGTLS